MSYLQKAEEAAICGTNSERLQMTPFGSVHFMENTFGDIEIILLLNLVISHHGSLVLVVNSVSEGRRKGPTS